jgi:hypothetical protein
MADRGEAHAVDEADCPWHPVSFERWPAWLQVTPSRRRHRGARGSSGGSRWWLTRHNGIERGSRPSGRMDLVYFIRKRAGHLSILLPLSQVHYCTKLSKECSKQNYRYCASIQLTCIHHLPKSKKILNFQKC